MQITLNPNINYASFEGRKRKKVDTGEFCYLIKKDDVVEKKIKKTVSELTYIMIGFSIIYFAAKRTFKYNKLMPKTHNLRNFVKENMKKNVSTSQQAKGNVTTKVKEVARKA